MYRTILLTFIVLFISACGQNPTIPTSDPALTPEATGPIPEQWNIKGKLGFRSSAKSGTVRLNWQQINSNYRIDVRAPLAQGSAIIYGDSKLITVEQAGKAPIQSINADKLLYNSLGLPLPLNDLPFWLRGLPNPNSLVTSEKRDSSDLLKDLQQSGWTLQYSRYKRTGQWFLPGKIIAQQGNEKFILIINEWEFL